MLRHSLLSLCLVALVFLVLAAPAPAQPPLVGDPYGFDPFWGSPYYGRGYGYENYESDLLNYRAQARPRVNRTYESFYPMSQQAEIPQNAALVEVRVPASAELWFSDEKTQQTGLVRDFVTPELKQGKNYFYTIKARWMQDGKPMERTRRVRVSPGAQTRVDFLRPE
jgi:uncharacterized protein (TIGR03000 family)